MGRTIRIVRVDAIRPNSVGVMAEVIRSNSANDRPRLRVVQYGIQVVRSVRVDVFRPNSVGVMADIIRSNVTKRLFPGIFCRWSEAVHVVRVGSARSNSWGVRVSVTWSNLANCLLGHMIWFEFDWLNFVGSASNFRSGSWMDFRLESWRNLRSKFWMNFRSNWSSGSASNFRWKLWMSFRSNCCRYPWSNCS